MLVQELTLNSTALSSKLNCFVNWKGSLDPLKCLTNNPRDTNRTLLAIGHYSPTKQATSLQEAGANSHLTRSLDQGRVSILYHASEAIYDHNIIIAMHLEFVYQHLMKMATPIYLIKFIKLVFLHTTLLNIKYNIWKNLILSYLLTPYFMNLIYEYFIY